MRLLLAFQLLLLGLSFKPNVVPPIGLTANRLKVILCTAAANIFLLYFPLLKKIIHTAIVACLYGTTFAQTLPAVVLTQITEEVGLSDNHVQCVLKDKQGLVWIGTADGVNLLDGSTITAFRHQENDSTSLANNNVLSLAEDNFGNIWMGTGGGICCYQKGTKNFLSIGPPPSIYGASNIVPSINVDPQARVWCGTDGGLFMYNISTKKWSAFFNLEAGEAYTGVNKIVTCLPAARDSLWIGCYNGLWLFDTKKSRFTRAVDKNNDANYEGLTNAIFEDSEKRLWFGNWTAGLKQLDRKTGRVAGYSALPNALSHVVSISEMALPDGRNVLCFNGSLTCFDADAGRFIQLRKPASFPEYPYVTQLYCSADGWLWMCSAKGLLVYNPQRQFFQHHFFNSSITSQSVNFFEWGNQFLIGGQGANFLTAYNAEGKVISTYSSLLKKASFNDVDRSNEATLCLTPEPSGTLLISNSGGLLRYHPQTGFRQWFSHKEGDSTSLPRNFVQHLFIDSKGGYWVFPWRSGIYAMNPLNGKCRLLCRGFLPEQSAIKGLLISDAAEDGEGNIWMADLDEGIVLYNRAANQFSKPFEKQLGGRMHSARVIYHNGFCYAFADDRLLKWNTVSKNLEVIPLPQQVRNTIWDLLLDAQSRCWIATKKGLLAYTENDHRFRRFTTADGLLSNDMDGTLYLKNNGDIIFGTPTYYTVFNPSALLTSSTSCTAATIITGIEANGVEMPYDSSKTVHLSYTDNNLVFHWALMDYASPFHNQYWCRLQGIDADWKYVGNKGEIQYANLAPGNYTLLLKSATANGITSDTIIPVHFNITPPFWKAGWFWVAWILAAVLMVYWLVNRRIKRIKTKAAIRQQMTELELKALKAQMNPHFIFNSLSSIQESIVNNKTEAASKYLGKFSKLIRSVLENSDKKWITLQQEIDYLTLYLELESFRFDNFHFAITADEMNDLSFIKIPSMLVQPYVENAIKHGLSHKNGDKKLTITFTEGGEKMLQVAIEDNGIGREASAIINQARLSSHQSMGMKITEARLQLQNGYAKQRVEILDLKSESGEPTGTRVIIYILLED